ncbi:MAG: T9SS type A sorting domain-containing protein [Bacteroidota bacterium]
MNISRHFRKSLLIASIFFSAQSFSQMPTVSSAILFRDSAVCAVWSQNDPTLVAYALLQSDGHYRLHKANVGPANQRLNEDCITCGNPLLPGKTEGNPIFHPNNKYLGFIAEKAIHPGDSFGATPGIGQYSDIWVMTMDGTKAYQLTNTPNSADSVCGIIFAFFSPDGKKMCWSQMTTAANPFDCIFPGKLCFGGWDIKIADFVDHPVSGPSLQNIKTIRPGGIPAFNEVYGWTPDGNKLLFASDYDQVWVWADQIYEMDTLGNNIKQLSATGGSVGWPYCEHAFSTPDGKHIVWITNRENMVGSSKGGDDWWIMNSDGTQQQRFTYFNDTTSSYWTGDTHINGFGCFSPDGKKFIGDVGGSQPIQTDPTQKYQVWIMDLNQSTGVQANEESGAKFHVYPNPATDQITLAVDIVDVGEYKIEIVNVLGQMVYQKSISINSTGRIETHLATGDLKPGAYVISVGNDNGIYKKKLLKE